MRKKQNGGWKLSDTDWYYFSFYNPSCFFYDSSWSESNFIFFLFFYSIRVGPSRSELIRPGLAVRVDPVRLLYLPYKLRFVLSSWKCITSVKNPHVKILKAKDQLQWASQRNHDSPCSSSPRFNNSVNNWSMWGSSFKQIKLSQSLQNSENCK